MARSFRQNSSGFIVVRRGRDPGAGLPRASSASSGTCVIARPRSASILEEDFFSRPASLTTFFTALSEVALLAALLLDRGGSGRGEGDFGLRCRADVGLGTVFGLVFGLVLGLNLPSCSSGALLFLAKVVRGEPIADRGDPRLTAGLGGNGVTVVGSRMRPLFRTGVATSAAALARFAGEATGVFTPDGSGEAPAAPFAAVASTSGLLGAAAAALLEGPTSSAACAKTASWNEAGGCLDAGNGLHR